MKVTACLASTQRPLSITSASAASNVTLPNNPPVTTSPALSTAVKSVLATPLANNSPPVEVSVTLVVFCCPETLNTSSASAVVMVMSPAFTCALVKSVCVRFCDPVSVREIPPVSVRRFRSSAASTVKSIRPVAATSSIAPPASVATLTCGIAPVPLIEPPVDVNEISSGSSASSTTGLSTDDCGVRSALRPATTPDVTLGVLPDVSTS